MVLKDFKMNVPGKGRVEVSFYLHFDAPSPYVGEIKIHTDYDSSLPHRAWLKQDEGTWKLFDEHPFAKGNEVAVEPEFLNDEVSNAIVEQILAIREQSM
jgi:hypothetical protein